MQAVLLTNDHGLRCNVNALLRTLGVAELAANTGVRDKIALLYFLRITEGKAGSFNWLFREIEPLSAALLDDKDGQGTSGCRVRVDFVHVGILLEQPGQEFAP